MKLKYPTIIVAFFVVLGNAFLTEYAYSRGSNNRWFASLWNSFFVDDQQYVKNDALSYATSELKSMYDACTDTVSYRIYQTIEQVLKKSIIHEYRYVDYVSRDLIKQLVISSLLDFIKQYSLAYARQYGAREKAEKISESMYQNALAHISQHGFMSSQELTPFVTTHLQKAVNNTSYSSDNQTASTLYPSRECAICTESFDRVVRVYLHPCGHDICITCAQRWFFDDRDSAKHTTCPICRTKVNKQQLMHDIKMWA